MEFQAKSGENC